MVVAQKKTDWQKPLPETLPETISSTSGKTVKKAVRRSPWRNIFLVILVFGMVGVIGAGRSYLSIVRNAEIKALQKDIAALKIQNDFYLVEVDQLRSVSRIESMALEMGMEKPAGTVYVVGSLAVANSGTGVQSSQVAPSEDETEAEEETEVSTIKQISQFFTGYFASTQH
ncbi:MAG: septum formation initiator family protein [Peptococcaceae bacterium]|nr:septum formation initiator family protein [Peptococcaceae bacterium]